MTTTARYTPTQALARAKSEAADPSQDWYRKCLRFVRTMVGIDARYPEADDAWFGADVRHTSGTPPMGAAVFWLGGQYGHVALSAGNGRVWTNDIDGRGVISLESITTITNKWKYHYVGWTEDLNGVKLQLPKPAAPGTWISYTIKEGDTLAGIARRINAALATVYNRNRSVLDTAAKAHGMRDSQGGKYIYPGTRISIPHGFPGQR